MANQDGTVGEQWKTLYEHCKNTVEKRAQIDDWEKIKIKKSNEKIKIKKAMNITYWTNQNYCSF